MRVYEVGFTEENSARKQAPARVSTVAGADGNFASMKKSAAMPKHAACGRRRLAASLGFLALLGLPATLAGEVSAEPHYVRLSYTRPAHTSMTVTWHTQTNVDGEVLYGMSSGNLDQSETGVTNPAPGSMGFIHEVTLNDLDPDTTYYYRVGEATEGLSLERAFTTAIVPHQDCGEYRFLFLGDNRPDPTFGGGENYDQILLQADDHSAAFVLAGGDLVIDGDNLGQWDAFLDYTESTSGWRPFMPCLGNHDTGPGEGDGAFYNRLFALPKSTGSFGSDTEDYYYFVYGNAIIVSLSTETFEDGAIPFKKQADYLDEVLTQHPQKWKVVMYHKPSYTHEAALGISHEPNEEKQNAALTPVFDAHHVDVVVSSHNHWYERYEPSACASQGDPGSDSPCPVGDPSQGTVFFVSGGAGAFTIPKLLCGLPEGRAVCTDEHHYMVFDVKDSKLTINTWGAYPQNNEVIDTLVIDKPSTVECAAVEPGGGAGGEGTASGGDSSGGGQGGSIGSGGDGAAGLPSGGNPDSIGSGGEGGTTSDGDNMTKAPGDSEAAAGCGCRVQRKTESPWSALGAAVLALGLLQRRRARRAR